MMQQVLGRHEDLAWQTSLSDSRYVETADRRIGCSQRGREEWKRLFLLNEPHRSGKGLESEAAEFQSYGLHCLGNDTIPSLDVAGYLPNLGES